MIGNIFKLMVFSFLENALASQKIESRHFYSSASQPKLAPTLYYHSPGRKKLLISSRRKGGGEKL